MTNNLSNRWVAIRLTPRRTAAWLLLIVLVGSLLRLIGLNSQSLGNDELSSRVDLVACTKGEIQGITERAEAEPGRYIWLMRGHKKLEEGFLEQLDAGFDVVQHSSLIGADVWLLRSK